MHMIRSLLSKAGNKMLRRLLVSAAQYILGAFGPPSALRDAGLRIAGSSGSKIAKKKAVVAVARKLAVLMIALWKDPEMIYQPFPAAQ